MIHRFAKYWLPLIAYAGFIFYCSSLARPFGELSLFPQADKFIHLFEFCLLGLLLRRAFLKASMPYFHGHAILYTFTFGIMYGISDEFHQSFVPGREVTVADLFFDSIGILLSLWIKIK